MAVLIAVAIERTGERVVLAVDVGPAEDHEFWKAFLRQLVERGLRGVRLVTSDAHLGLEQVVAEVLVGATWQRCRVPFMRAGRAPISKRRFMRGQHGGAKCPRGPLWPTWTRWRWPAMGPTSEASPPGAPG